MHLCLAALTIAVPSSLVSCGSGWRGWARSTKLQSDSLVGLPRPTAYPSMRGRYCTGFHSHNTSHTRWRSWCGGACLTGRPPIWKSCHPSLFLFRPPYTAVLCPWGFSLSCNNTEMFFLWLVQVQTKAEIWFEISAPTVPPSQLNYDEYTDPTLLVGRWDNERGLVTCPQMPRLRKWNH